SSPLVGCPRAQGENGSSRPAGSTGVGGLPTASRPSEGRGVSRDLSCPLVTGGTGSGKGRSGEWAWLGGAPPVERKLHRRCLGPVDVGHSAPLPFRLERRSHLLLTLSFTSSHLLTFL